VITLGQATPDNNRWLITLTGQIKAILIDNINRAGSFCKNFMQSLEIFEKMNIDQMKTLTMITFNILDYIFIIVQNRFTEMV
jgi:hypothetical protein